MDTHDEKGDIKQVVWVILVGATLLYAVECSCPFPPTNQVLQNVCDWSNWLPWNCTCCGPDVATQPFAIRYRGLCCAKGEPVDTCMINCGYSYADDRMPCNSVCGNKTTNSACVLADRVTMLPTTTSTPTTPTTTTTTTRAPTTRTSTATTFRTTTTSITTTHPINVASSTQSTHISQSGATNTGFPSTMLPNATTITSVSGGHISSSGGLLTTPASSQSGPSKKSSGNGSGTPDIFTEEEVIAIATGASLVGLLGIAASCCLVMALKKKRDKDRVKPASNAVNDW